MRIGGVPASRAQTIKGVCACLTDVRKGKSVRLIDKEELLKKQAITYDYNGYKVGIIKVTDVAEAPEVPAVTPVRCKDCKYADVFFHCGYMKMWMTENDFCSRGVPLE